MLRKRLFATAAAVVSGVIAAAGVANFSHADETMTEKAEATADKASTSAKKAKRSTSKTVRETTDNESAIEDAKDQGANVKDDISDTAKEAKNKID